jgi:hypothetical protein
VRLGDDAVDELYVRTVSRWVAFMEKHPERIGAMGVSTSPVV